MNNEAQAGGGLLNTAVSLAGTTPGITAATTGLALPDMSTATALTGVMQSLTELTGKVTAMNESVGRVKDTMVDAEKSMVTSVDKSLKGGLPAIVKAAKVAAENAVNGTSPPENMSGEPNNMSGEPNNTNTNSAAPIGGGRQITPKKRSGSKSKRTSVKNR